MTQPNETSHNKNCIKKKTKQFTKKLMDNTKMKCYLKKLYKNNDFINFKNLILFLNNKLLKFSKCLKYEFYYNIIFSFYDITHKKICDCVLKFNITCQAFCSLNGLTENDLQNMYMVYINETNTQKHSKLIKVLYDFDINSDYNLCESIYNTYSNYVQTFLAKRNSKYVKATSSYGNTPYTFEESEDTTIYNAYCVVSATKFDTTTKIYANNIVTYQPKSWGVLWIAGNNITQYATGDNNPSQEKILYGEIDFEYNENTSQNWLKGKNGWPSSANELYSTSLGIFGLTLNGAALYNPLGSTDIALQNNINNIYTTIINGEQFTVHSVATNVESFSTCCGHSSGQISELAYHYHMMPRCLKSICSLNGVSNPDPDSTPIQINNYYKKLLKSQIHPGCIGFMRDGCPVYSCIGYEYELDENGKYLGVKKNSNGSYKTCYKKSPYIRGNINLNGFHPFIINNEVSRWWGAYYYNLKNEGKTNGSYLDACHGCFGLTPDFGECYHYHITCDVDDDGNFLTDFDTLYPYDFYGIIYDYNNTNILKRIMAVFTYYGLDYTNFSESPESIGKTSLFIKMLYFFYSNVDWNSIGLTISGYNVPYENPNPDGYYTGTEQIYSSYANYESSYPSTGILDIWQNDNVSLMGFHNFFTSEEQQLFYLIQPSKIPSNLFIRGESGMSLTLNQDIDSSTTWVENVNSSLSEILNKNATYENLKPKIL
jgi:hypothetical protein